jgi:hypothetical protein
MFKMGSHRPFGHLKHKLWPKERLGVELVVWLPTTKSWESTRFASVQAMCDIQLEIFRQRLQLCTRSSAPSKSLESKLGNFGTPKFGSPKTKSHLDVAPVEFCRIYYKGEGGASPKSRLWWVLCVEVAYGLS